MGQGETAGCVDGTDWRETVIFKPRFIEYKMAMSARNDGEIKIEPMLYGASYDFAMKNGGPVTKEFLGLIHGDKSSIFIDSRVHMLKPGWYPAIPGWHLDAIPRSKTNRQPDFSQDTSSLGCFFAIVGSRSYSGTEFLADEIDVSINDGKKWSEFSAEINAKIENGLKTTLIQNRSFVEFGPTDFHRATPATDHCFRLFIRAMRGHHIEPKNEIRTQTQVYVRDLEAGW